MTMHSKHDKMYRYEIFYVLIYINNHVSNEGVDPSIHLKGEDAQNTYVFPPPFLSLIYRSPLGAHCIFYLLGSEVVAFLPYKREGVHKTHVRVSPLPFSYLYDLTWGLFFCFIYGDRRSMSSKIMIKISNTVE